MEEGQLQSDQQQSESDANQNAPKKKVPPGRKYSWGGIVPKNPKIINQYGNVKIRPWSMTDDEIDAVIKKHPELARLWKKN
jgi:hypothetical protein